VVEYTKGSDGLINSDASNLSTNASSLNLATLVNGNYDETTETWPNYTTEGVAYLQVDLTGKEVSDFYLTMVPRSGGYYKDDMPKAWTIEASDNATDWTFINTEATDGSKVVATTLYTAPVIHLGKQFKYVRFTSPGSISGRTNHPDHFALAEFQLYAAGDYTYKIVGGIVTSMAIQIADDNNDKVVYNQILNTPAKSNSRKDTHNTGGNYYQYANFQIQFDDFEGYEKLTFSVIE
jgi:hypothetical protein